ncbi:ABC transporter substrate-binding protein [Paenibacillus tarimensis]
MIRVLWRKSIAILIVIMLSITGCSAEPQTEYRSSIKVFFDPQGFEYTYRDFFDAAFPNLDVEVVYTDNANYFSEPDPDAELMKAIEEKQPDLIILPFYLSLYKKLADDGQLVELSSRLSRNDGLTWDDIHPGVIEQLKQNEQGGIFGLAPLFETSLLYYNADLFDTYGVDPPQDGMSWEEILHLAIRFKTEAAGAEGIAGYHQMFAERPYDLITNIAGTEGIRPFDLKQKRMTIDTPQWRSVVHTVVEALRHGAFTTEVIEAETIDGVKYFGPEDQARADLFRQGKAAMTMDRYGSYTDVGFRAHAVVSPVNSSDRLRSDKAVRYFTIFAIRSGSEHVEQVWEVLKYMNGERVAQITALQPDVMVYYNISSHKAFPRYKKDPIADKIFNMLPVQTSYTDFSRLDKEFYDHYLPLFDREIGLAVSGELSVEQALANIQKEGQSLLEKYVK